VILDPRPTVRIFHPGGYAAGAAKVYIGDADVSGNVTRIEIVMDAASGRPVEVKLTMLDAGLDVTGDLASEN
jgi:hypothetical protein